MKNAPLLLGCLIAVTSAHAITKEDSAKRREMFGEAADLQRLPPIVLPKSAPAAEEFLRQHASWAQRTFLQPFDTRAKGAPWEKEAHAFAEEALRVWTKENVHRAPSNL